MCGKAGMGECRESKDLWGSLLCGDCVRSGKAGRFDDSIRKADRRVRKILRLIAAYTRQPVSPIPPLSPAQNDSGDSAMADGSPWRYCKMDSIHQPLAVNRWPSASLPIVISTGGRNGKSGSGSMGVGKEWRNLRIE